MNIINRNSKIINPAPQPARETVAEQPTLLAQWEQYQFGGDLFAAREPLTACQSAQQRRGWWDALKRAADAETFAYLHGGNR